MFTGIIETRGIVRSAFFSSVRASMLEIEPQKTLLGLKIGSSVAVNGACLTVFKKRGKRLFFQLVRETLHRTTLGGLKAGEKVNLERSMRVGARFEGHKVLGHVDGVGRVRKILESRKNEKSIFIAFPGKFRPFLVEKGSIAVDGVSLTLGKVSKGGFWVHCIPHTLKITSLGGCKPGSRVNLETDVLAKLSRSPKAYRSLKVRLRRDAFN